MRKHRAAIMGDTVASSASSAFGAATSMAGNEYAKATDSASLALQDAFNLAVDTWSESRLKAYLDARGIVSAFLYLAEPFRSNFYGSTP